MDFEIDREAPGELRFTRNTSEFESYIGDFRPPSSHIGYAC